MARISDLNAYNHIRRDDDADFIGYDYDNSSVKFTNSYGDDIVIKPKELKEELHKFIDQELLSQTQDDIEQKKEYLKRELDKKLNEFELSLKQHVENKINKITQEVIENVMSRTFEDRVKQEVKQRLKKLLEE
jgi:hypothetical protein